MSDYSNRLAQISAALSECTDDALTKENLSYEAFRLRMGAVRICVLGQTSAGKSTLINALMKKIVVPESGNTSSPVPVWFTYGQNIDYKVYWEKLPEDWTADSKEPEIELPEGENLGMRVLKPEWEKFIKKYCFNTSDIAKSDRARYNDVKFVSANVPAEILERETTMIDTLGISATNADTAKTIGILGGGVDIVIFVTRSDNLHDDEQEFLLKRVFALGEEKMPWPVDPSRVFFVYNNFSPLSINRQGLEESVDKLYRALQLNEEQRQKLLKENIFVVRALHARRLEPGLYDYEKLCPEGT